MYNWIRVEDDLPPNSPVGPDTDRVLVFVERDYGSRIFIASGEYTEDGFIWTIEGEPDKTSPYKIKKITHWTPLDERKPSNLKY